jgi:hypothetical protein
MTDWFLLALAIAGVIAVASFLDDDNNKNGFAS